MNSSTKYSNTVQALYTAFNEDLILQTNTFFLPFSALLQSEYQETDLESYLNKVEKLGLFFSETKKLLINTIKQKVENEANNIFIKFEGNNNYILKINDQYKLEMFEKDYQENPLEISTGQSVIVMYSLIYAFRKAANFDGDIQLVFFHPEFKFKDKDDQVVFVFDDDGNPIGIHPTSSLFGVSMKTKN